MTMQRSVHVEIGLADHVGERRQEIGIEAVHRLGAVQRQDQDPLFRPLLQQNLSHATLLDLTVQTHVV